MLGVWWKYYFRIFNSLQCSQHLTCDLINWSTLFSLIFVTAAENWLTVASSGKVNRRVSVDNWGQISVVAVKKSPFNLPWIWSLSFPLSRTLILDSQQTPSAPNPPGLSPACPVGIICVNCHLYVNASSFIKPLGHIPPWQWLVVCKRPRNRLHRPV